MEADISFTTTPIVVPTLTTVTVTSVTGTTAVSGGTITSDGNGAITAKGVCWATTTGPTITNSLTTDGTGSASFVSNLTGLSSGITYYVRAYATNSAGTAYGNEISFITILGAPTNVVAAPGKCSGHGNFYSTGRRRSGNRIHCNFKSWQYYRKWFNKPHYSYRAY